MFKIKIVLDFFKVCTRGVSSILCWIACAPVALLVRCHCRYLSEVQSVASPFFPTSIDVESAAGEIVVRNEDKKKIQENSDHVEQIFGDQCVDKSGKTGEQKAALFESTLMNQISHEIRCDPLCFVV